MDKIRTQIENPNSKRLKMLYEDARERVKNEITDWDVSEELVDDLAYSHYYNPDTDDPEYVLLLQNPANLQNRHREILEKDTEIDETVPLSVYRDFSKSWLLDNEIVAKQFFDVCSQYGLVEYDQWEGYIESEEFLTNFYHTNIIKYRDDSYTSGCLTESFSLVESELSTIDPEIVFVFGGDAWKTVYSNSNPECLTSIKGDAQNVTDAHGHLFEIELSSATTSAVIPLSHLSGRNYSSCLRDSYIQYLQSGLKAYRERAEST